MKRALVLLLCATFCLAVTAELIKMPTYNSTLSIDELLERPYGFEGNTYRQYFESEGIDPFSLSRNILEDASLLTVRLIHKYNNLCYSTLFFGLFSMN